MQNLGDKVRTYNIKTKNEAERWNMDTKLEAVNYRIQITAMPGDAIFEGIFYIANVAAVQDRLGSTSKDVSTMSAALEIKQISRISKYSHQQTCSGPFKAAYCVCKVFYSQV
jgi:hypothetical protein